MIGEAWLTGAMTVSNKKSETIEVRLPYATKLAFAERCRVEGVTVSAAVRGFVDARLRRRPSPLVPLAVLAAIVAVVAAAPVKSGPDFSTGYAALDHNGDGIVTAAEVVARPWHCSLALPLKREGLGGGPRPFALCRDRSAFTEIDRDRDGLVTQVEYAQDRKAFLHRGYAALDRNGDGSLDAAEYAVASRTSFLPPAPRLASFRELDRNRDGRIAWAEYLA